MGCWVIVLLLGDAMLLLRWKAMNVVPNCCFSKGALGFEGPAMTSMVLGGLSWAYWLGSPWRDEN